MIFFANQLIGIHMVRASTKRSSWKSFRFWMGIKPFNMTLFLFFFPDFTLSIASYVSRVNLQPFRYNVFSVSSDEVMVINKFSRWWNSQYLFSSVKITSANTSNEKNFFYVKEENAPSFDNIIAFSYLFYPFQFSQGQYKYVDNCSYRTAFWKPIVFIPVIFSH